MNTYYDFLNSIEFAHNCSLLTLYEHFFKKYPHIFKHVTVNSRLASHEDFYVPVSIANECKINSISFNEIGCRKVGCFPKTNTLTDCSENNPTSYIEIADKFYLSCQPACHDLSKSIDTEFRNGKCFQVNSEKKIFALFPEKIHGIEFSQPMHKGLNFENGNLAINKDYCTAFGLSFENDDCIAPIGQEIAEFFLGSTVYKSLKKITTQQSLNKIPPLVPNDVKNLKNWLEGSQSMKKKSNYQSKSSIPYIASESSSEILRDFMKNLVIDASFDLTIDYSIKVMKKRIPNSILKLSSRAINQKLVQSAMMKTIIQSHALSFAGVARGLFSTLSKVNIAMSLFGTISNIIDIFDPFNYNYVLNKATLSKINEQLDYAFYRSNNRNVEITPEKIWNLLETDMSIYIDELESKMDYYLKAVKLEDYKLRSKIQKEIFQKRKIKTEYNWHKVFHLSFVIILIIGSILFIQFIAYFMLIYLIFILVSPPSFY